jgi:hypothetical protein
LSEDAVSYHGDYLDPNDYNNHGHYDVYDSEGDFYGFYGGDLYDDFDADIVVNEGDTD